MRFTIVILAALFVTFAAPHDSGAQAKPAAKKPIAGKAKKVVKPPEPVTFKLVSVARQDVRFS